MTPLELLKKGIAKADTIFGGDSVEFGVVTSDPFNKVFTSAFTVTGVWMEGEKQSIKDTFGYDYALQDGQLYTFAVDAEKLGVNVISKSQSIKYNGEDFTIVGKVNYKYETLILVK